jgi:hypothetical protein
MTDYQPLTPARMISIQKAALWEEAKGKLRAVVATGGACATTNEAECGRWRGLDKLVEEFINEAEGEGFTE